MRLLHDDRFKKLSRPQPCGQWLWAYLLFGPRTIVVPGLIPVGLGGIADDLRWPAEATKESWEEIAALKMAESDFSAPLIWLPKAMMHNVPPATSTCKAWARSMIEDVPECPLRLKALRSITAFLKTELSTPFLRAFLDALPADLRQAAATPAGRPADTPAGSGSGSPVHTPGTEAEAEAEVPDQRSDQERADSAHASGDTVQGTLRLAVPRRASTRERTPADLHEFVLGYERARARHRGTTLGRTPDRDWKLAKQFLKDMPDATRRQVLVENFITTRATGYPYDGARTLHQFLSHWQDIEAALVDAGQLARVAPLSEVGNA